MIQGDLKFTLRGVTAMQECIDRMMLSNAKLKRESVELLVERGITYVDEGVRFAHDPKLRYGGRTWGERLVHHVLMLY